MEYKVLANISDARMVEEEERVKFIYYTLENLGIPLNDVWEHGNWDLSVDLREKLNNLLRQYTVEIADFATEETEIWVGEDLVARWRKPTYFLKKDYSIKGPKKFYVELNIKYDTILEEEDNVK
jgi:hypothetical protein